MRRPVPVAARRERRRFCSPRGDAAARCEADPAGGAEACCRRGQGLARRSETLVARATRRTSSRRSRSTLCSAGGADVAARLAGRVDGLRGCPAPPPQKPLPGGGALTRRPAGFPCCCPSEARGRGWATWGRGGRRSAGLVGGQTADFVDFKASLADHAPEVIALIVITTTAILLPLMTGSLILPLKTLVMNALSIAATFGLMVLAFQDAGLLGLGRRLRCGGPRPRSRRSLLVVIGATTFGLATDYAVLVLARIKEYRDRGLVRRAGGRRSGDRAHGARDHGLVVFVRRPSCPRRSERREIYFMKQVPAFGQAIAVVIDATIVRALLVPVADAARGAWNWWAPGPLRRLHRRLRLSET